MKRQPPQRAKPNCSGNSELAFLRHAFESFGRAFDPVLAVIAFGRKQPDHLIGAGGGRTGHVAGGEIDGLSNGEFVLQRHLHHARTPAALTVPLAVGRLKYPGELLAWRALVWPVHRGMASTRILQVFQRDNRNFSGSGTISSGSGTGARPPLKRAAEGCRSGSHYRPPWAATGRARARADRAEC